MDEATGGDVLSVVGPLGLSPEQIPVLAGVLWGLGVVCTGLVAWSWLRIYKRRAPGVTLQDMLFTSAAWKGTSVVPEARKDQTRMVAAFMGLMAVALALAWFGFQVSLIEIPAPAAASPDATDNALL